MNAAQALGRLRSLGMPCVTTGDAAAVLEVSVQAASHTLRRLAASGLVVPIRRSLWALEERPDPFKLLEYVTAPYPAYLSLQTALYQHGMIEQIPSMVFAVSLTRTGRIATQIATYSIHHVQTNFFDGFTQLESGAKLATPEKALVDHLYLSPTRGRLFHSLPELTLPRGFRRQAAREWATRISSPRLRTIVTTRLEQIFAATARRPSVRETT